jgi:hypothetical protein
MPDELSLFPSDFHRTKEESPSDHRDAKVGLIILAALEKGVIKKKPRRPPSTGTP